jgi:hypothetical protein
MNFEKIEENIITETRRYAHENSLIFKYYHEDMIKNALREQLIQTKLSSKNPNWFEELPLIVRYCWQILTGILIGMLLMLIIL